MTHVRFPPGGSLLIPVSSSRACRSGISMWSACRPAARALRAGVYHSVGLIGTVPLRLMAHEDWRAPIDAATWHQLNEAWSSWFGHFDEMALYQRPQAERAGFACLLLEQGVAVGFVKCRPDTTYRAEAALIKVAASARSFMTPALKGETTISGWSTLGLAPISSGLHSARLPKSPAGVAEETAHLLSGLHPGDPKRSHWVPMHGDMGPWNLRHLVDTGFILFDWENSRLGPPGADLVFHAAACRAMGVRGTANVEGFAEAAEFWSEEIPRRFGRSSTDQKLATQMLEALTRLL